MIRSKPSLSSSARTSCAHCRNVNAPLGLVDRPWRLTCTTHCGARTPRMTSTVRSTASRAPATLGTTGGPTSSCSSFPTGATSGSPSRPSSPTTPKEVASLMTKQVRLSRIGRSRLRWQTGCVATLLRLCLPRWPRRGWERRQHHSAHGRLVSGWRSRAYSQHLCYAMCGRPQCPGRCAGMATNHVYSQPDRFAIDVSDYGTFGRLMQRYPGRKIRNSLGSRDPVHFSPSGT